MRIRKSVAWPWLASACFLTASSCYHEAKLVPAPTAQQVASSTQDEVAGVRLVAMTNTWKGDPADLSALLTPLQVTVTNHSGQPLKIHYRDLMLVTRTGQWTAISPYNMANPTGTHTPEVLVPEFTYSNYAVAPYYTPYYSFGVPMWDEAYDFNQNYYLHDYEEWPIQLPTQDMIKKAIPEGVLRDNGSVSGFLYFPQVKESMKYVTFVAALIDAHTGKTFATLRIPFIVSTK